jgi:hypothetical protein
MVKDGGELTACLPNRKKIWKWLMILAKHHEFKLDDGANS